MIHLTFHEQTFQNCDPYFVLCENLNTEILCFHQSLFIRAPRMTRGIICFTWLLQTTSSRWFTKLSNVFIYILWSSLFKWQFCAHSSFLNHEQEYERALKYIRTLLKNEPGNSQALELEKLIDKAMRKGEREYWLTEKFSNWPVFTKIILIKQSEWRMGSVCFFKDQQT